MTRTINPIVRRRLSQIEIALAESRFTFSNEAELQRGIELAIRGKETFQGLGEIREVDLGAHGRIDFLVAGIGIECKVKGSVAQIAAQLLRYLESPRVDALLLVTTKRAHLALNTEYAGKRLRVHVLTGGLA